MDAFSRFTWLRTEAGYVWVLGRALEGKDRTTEQWYLTDGVPFEKKKKEAASPIETVDPKGLFRRFAHIPLHEVWDVKICPASGGTQGFLVPTTRNNPIVTFAQKYGLLTNGVPVEVTREGQRDAEHIVIGEPLSLWETEIECMRRALNVVDNLRPPSGGAPDLKALSKVIVWEGDAVAYEPRGNWDGLREIIWHKHIKDLTLKRGDVEQAAWLYLRQTINQHLSRYVFPHFAIERRIPLLMRLQFTSTSFLGWMWLQLARFVDKGEFRKCLYCGTPFVVAPSGARSNRRYCKDGCRVMDCRKRSEKKARSRTVKSRGTSQRNREEE